MRPGSGAAPFVQSGDSLNSARYDVIAMLFSDWTSKPNFPFCSLYCADACNELTGPSLRHCAWAIQLFSKKNVAEVASHWSHCVRLDLPEIPNLLFQKRTSVWWQNDLSMLWFGIKMRMKIKTYLQAGSWWAVNAIASGARIWGSIPGPVSLKTVPPKAHFSCYISS